MTGDNWEYLTLERNGRVLEVSFRSANPVNALNNDLMRELTALAGELQYDAELSAIILTGTGQTFSGGMDLKDAQGALSQGLTKAEQRQLLKIGPDMCAAWERLEQVTLCALEGWCIGGGAALAVSCDWRVAARDARIYVPELKLGMNMSWQSVPRFNHLIGPSRTKQLLILAEPVDADTALQWGLFDYVTEPGGAMDRARALAAQVAEMPPIPVRMAKRGINASATALDNAVSFMDADQFMLTQGMDDAREGITAFFEKREANFSGD